MTNAAILVDLLLGLVDRASAISALLSKAKSEGRDVTEDELNGLAAADDVAKANLDAAIKKARGV